MFAPRFCATLAVIAASALPVGCGDDEDAKDEISVIATTAIAADIATNIGGNDIEVTQLIPDALSPHEFQASAKDRQAIAESDLLIEFGSGLEATVPTGAATAIFAIADHAGELHAGSHEHEEGEGDQAAEHEEGNEHESEEPSDPHVWMDPTRIAIAAPELAAAIAAADPGNRDAYARRGREYAKRLRELDREIAELTGGISEAGRKLVTSHDAISYFADRYGFEVVATPFGLSPEAEASAKDINEVIEVVEREDVPAVFVEQGDDPQVLERVAEATGVEVVDDLLVEGFGPGAESYEEMIRLTARRIAEALGR